MENDVLTIKNNSTIKKWKSSDFPEDFKIIKWWEIYQNSNMQKYAFIIADNQTIETVSNYYKKELELTWWKLEMNKEVVNINNENQETENIQQTSDSLKFTKNIWEDQISELNIDINSDIPKILEENFNFKWIFIEIRFNDLFIQQEISD